MALKFRVFLGTLHESSSASVARPEMSDRIAVSRRKTETWGYKISAHITLLCLTIHRPAFPCDVKRRRSLAGPCSLSVDTGDSGLFRNSLDVQHWTQLKLQLFL